jgi:hypothetical protein
MSDPNDSLPQRMREAAQTLRAVAAIDGDVIPENALYFPAELEAKADAWEAAS